MPMVLKKLLDSWNEPPKMDAFTRIKQEYKDSNEELLKALLPVQQEEIQAYAQKEATTKADYHLTGLVVGNLEKQGALELKTSFDQLSSGFSSTVVPQEDVELVNP